MIIYNGCSGLGGNRKLWSNEHRVTAIERDKKIAAIYQRLYPNDNVIVADAFEYLLEHCQEADFWWLSPPCQGNSKMIRSGRNRKPRYPDCKLYEIILFLKHNFKGLWVVENVVPYYKPLIEPTQQIGRHLFWSNFEITPMVDAPKSPKGMMRISTVGQKKEMMDWLGIHYEENVYYNGNHCPVQILRNCVHPDLGNHVLNCALRKIKQPVFKPGQLFN